MDSSDVLSNDEVDALMDDHPQEDGDETGAEDASAPAGEAELFDLINIENNMANYPAIQSLNELFIIDLTKAFSNFIGRKVKLNTRNLQLSTLRQYQRHLSETPVYNGLLLKAYKSIGLFIIEGNFLSNCMTLLYGGQLTENNPGRKNIGHIEVGIAQRLTHTIMKSFNTAWADICQFDYDILKTTTNFTTLTKIDPNESFFIAEYYFTLEEQESAFMICIPRSIIDQYQRALSAGHQALPNEMEKRQWQQTLSHSVFDSTLSLKAKFPSISCPLSKLLSLSEGDVIPITNPELVDVYCNDIKLYTAKTGTANGNRVIQIIDKHNQE